MSRFVEYEHHGAMVKVDKELKGKHREHCLCYKCTKFKVGDKTACEIAQSIFANCVEYNVVTPVYECPEFTPSEEWMTSTGSL